MPLPSHGSPENLHEQGLLVRRHHVDEGSQPLSEICLDWPLVGMPHTIEQGLPDLEELEGRDVMRLLQVPRHSLNSLLASLLVCE